MQWYEKAPERLVLETRLIRQTYPETRLVKQDNLIRVRLAIRGRRARYQCELVYPKRFPWDEIKAYVREPSLSNSPHQYGGGRVCLHHPEDVGQQTTAVVEIEWLKGWISRYERFLRTGKWVD